MDIINQIINKINDKNVRNIAIVSHTSPDGDSVASSQALMLTLQKLGKKVDIICHNPIPQGYGKLIGENNINKIIIPSRQKFYDLVFLLDCSEYSRTINNVDKMGKCLIVIDHHYGMRPIGNIYLYEKACSTGAILYKIIRRLVPITEEIATCLYLTIRSDTGSFKNNNTDVRSHEIAADLLSRGANIQLINEIYETRSMSFLKLLGRVLKSVKYDNKYKYIYVAITVEDVQESKSNYEEASMLIDYIRNIEDVDISFLFIEGYNNIRIKARSKRTDVNEILLNFNGGGHANAAGALVYSSDLHRVIDNIINYTEEHIQRTHNENYNLK